MTDWKTLQSDLAEQGYVAGAELAMALHLSLALGRPLLLEGAAGVGKTEIAHCLAAVKGTNLIQSELEASTVSPSASAEITALSPTEDFPHLPAPDRASDPASNPASDPASGDMHSIEERIRSRVLEVIEPRIQAYLDDSHRLEDLMRETAARVAAETREDIMSLIRDAVRTAVVQETELPRDTRPGGR